MIGTRLSHYEITSHLGSGGMGDVYQATDSKLGRSVAVKFLSESFASDVNRVTRFEREARVLASLNHPNIAAIYGLEDSNGKKFLVMELVAGDTLADSIRRGPIPIGEAMGIAKQIAEALEAAHEQGVIHRDLKPANIKVREDGTVKVLDFGLAKALDPASESTAASPSASQSPTLSMHATQAGMIIGTAAYMSPEQARGKRVDKRADVWAFGCVLYEMLTARRPFEDEDVSLTLSKVLQREPDFDAFPAEVPARVRQAIRLCLRKSLKERIGDIGAVRLALEGAFESSPDSVIATTMPQPAASKWPWAMAALATIAAVAIGTAHFREAVPAAALTRLEMGIQPADQLGTSGTAYARPSRTALALSSDGRRIVFSGRRGTVTQLFSRPLDQSEAAPIPGTEGGSAPFFSNDGKWIGFWVDQNMKKVPVDGGVAVTIYEGTAGARSWGASWAEDDTIFFAARPNEISKTTLAGKSESVAKSDSASGEGFLLPQSLPGGKAVLFTAVRTAEWDEARIVLQPLPTGERRVLIEGGADARYVPSGHLVYVKSGTMMAVPFDPGTLQVTGEPVALVEGVMQSANMSNSNLETGAGQFAVSKSGTLIYLTGGTYPKTDSSLVWVDRKGVAQPLPGPVRPQMMPRLSPNREKLAVTISGGTRNSNDLWVYDLVHGSQNRLTFKSSNLWPIWSPDGKRLVFTSNASGQSNLYVMNASDANTPPERLTNSAYAQTASSWTAAGNLIAYLQTRPGEKTQIWVLPMDGERKPRLFVESPEPRFTLRYPEFSPDGKWLAYVSNESGSDAVYVQPYPGPGERFRISQDGAVSPAWTANGREIVYRTGGTTTGFYSVAITSINPFRWDPPRLLFEVKPTEYGNTTPIRGWDITPDGQRFLLTRFAESKDKPVSTIQIILNWTEELKRRVPAK